MEHKTRFRAALMAALCFAPLAARAADPVVTGDQRVDHLLAQMTREEKLALIQGAQEDPATNQGQAGYLAGVKRLGIPPLRLADGPPGVLTRVPSQGETSTMGLAATFSTKDAIDNGVVIAREAKSLGVDIVLEPFVNMVRDITSSRSYNTYGEDPLLSGAIGAGLVRGVQGQGVMAEAKHYMGYDADAEATVIDDQTPHEIYVAPFAATVQAGVASIMCSHNDINGTSACGNPDTLTKILRDELGFKGFVVSDWGAIHSPHSLAAGADVEMPGELTSTSPMAAMMGNYYSLKQPGPPPTVNAAAFAGMVGMGIGGIPEEPPMKMMNMAFVSPSNYPRIDLWNLLQTDQAGTDAAITTSAGRVLYEINRFGYLDHPPSHQLQPHDTEANAKIIEKTAEDAAVLLKNDDHVLPLAKGQLNDVALIGPGAGQVVGIGAAGERSVGFPWRQVGPWQALKKLVPGANPSFAVADDMTGHAIPAANLSHDGSPGLLRTGPGGATSVDGQLEFTDKTHNAFAANTMVRWSGELSVPAAGEYWIYFQLLGAGGSLSIDGKPIAGAGGTGGLHGDTVLGGKDGLLPTTDGLDNIRRAVPLTAGAHKIEVTVQGDTSNAPEQVRLAWTTPDERAADRAAAIEAAKAAKVAVVFAWTNGRPQFGLPGDQEKLIEDVAAVNPNTVVVLNANLPIAMPWLDKVKSVLLMWNPGDEGGWATAKLLDGEVSPAGRLPFTWAAHLTDYAANDPKYPERAAGKETKYTEGVDIGYRWFDRTGTAPLFPFGYGLGYSSFGYSKLAVAPASDGGLAVSFDLSNQGSMAADEVPQIYLGAPATPPAHAAFAVRALAGFDRVHLAAGQTKHVTVHVAPRALEYWSVDVSGWKRATGERDVSVGASSRDLKLTKSVDVE